MMDRCARLEVRIERKWKLRTGFISDWIKFFFFFASLLQLLIFGIRVVKEFCNNIIEGVIIISRFFITREFRGRI